MNLKQEVLEAEQRIRSYIRETPLEYSIALSHKFKTQIYLKYENIQYTGSFKVRGAFNKLLSLTKEEKIQGVVAASSGNHGAAVAYGLTKLKIQGTIFVPETASQAKIANIRNYKVKLEFYNTEYIKTAYHAIEYAKQHQQVYISPYNDLKVIAGQGTIGYELEKQLKKIDVVLVPVGGGGLIAGIAGYLKAINPEIEIIGCSPDRSPVMADSIRAGKILQRKIPSTISDATAVGVVPNSITFNFCQKYVDDYILVTEDEIKAALVELIQSQHILVEGAAAVPLAALCKNQSRFENKNIVVILSGANISLPTLQSVLADYNT